METCFAYDNMGRTRAVTRVGDDGEPYTEISSYRSDGRIRVDRSRGSHGSDDRELVDSDFHH